MSDDLPYGIDTIVIPFTRSNPQSRRQPWRRFGGPRRGTGPGRPPSGEPSSNLHPNSGAGLPSAADVASSIPPVAGNETGPGTQDPVPLAQNAASSPAGNVAASPMPPALPNASRKLSP